MTSLLPRVALFAGLLMASHFVAGIPVTGEEPFIPRRQSQLPGPPLEPAEAVAKMTVPPGFRVELVASEPDLVNPVAMCFDEQGRIWVTESLEYPRRQPGPGRDRVKVLEDTNGDGRADRVTIFADGLNIPSGIAVGHGGVWVANSPDILFLQDTDGDLKADKREVIVTGFGRTDTHELPNSLTWGPDGWLYGLNGVFNHSHVKHRGEEFHFTCAMFRINPRTREFQLFAEGTSNPWGIAWDNEGSAFISACVIDHLWHITESGYYQRQAGAYPAHTRPMGSIVKHKHQAAAYCGLTYFDSPAYPEKYRNKLYMGNIHGGCINADAIRRDGSTYFATGEPDFLTANDVWFMPVVQKVGPDGCLYVLDWYDRYHCYQDANRDPEGIDRLKGRLYRVRYENTPRRTGFNLASLSDEKLLDHLTSPNIYDREIAQRLLQERADAATRSRLQVMVLDEQLDVKYRRHALWSLMGGGPLEAGFHQALLSQPEPSLRAWAVRAAGNAGKVAPEIQQQLAKAGRDADPRVLLQAAIAAPKVDGVDPLPVLVDVLSRAGDDRLLPHVVWQNLHPLLETRADEFLALLRERDVTNQANVAALMPSIVERILARSDKNPQPIIALTKLLLTSEGGSTTSAAQCLDTLAYRVQTREIAGDQLAALKQEVQPLLAKVFEQKQNDSLVVAAALLATSWRDEAGLTATRQLVVDAKRPARLRLRAFEALIAAGDDQLLATADRLLAAKEAAPFELRATVLSSLSRAAEPAVAGVVLKHYSQLEPDLKPRAIELLTTRPAWAKPLLAAIGREEIPAAALNVNQVQKLLASGDEELANQVRQRWGTIRADRNPQRAEVIAEMRQLIRRKPGDAHAGVAVFKKVCAQCHQIYGEGQNVGPDITRNGRGSFEQLLSNVFDPSLVIGAAYQARTVLTTDGRIFTGLVQEENDQRIVLTVQGGKREVIPRAEVDETFLSEVSLMPEGLEKQLSQQELVDLFAYLTLDRPPTDPTARQLPGVREIERRETGDAKQFPALVAEVAPGFTTTASGVGGVAIEPNYQGRPVALRTHPINEKQPCVLTRNIEVPADGKTLLKFAVAPHEQGDWRLVAKLNGNTVRDVAVTQRDGEFWTDVALDLTPHAGKSVKVELLNAATGWHYEFGYWGWFELINEDE